MSMVLIPTYKLTIEDSVNALYKHNHRSTNINYILAKELKSNWMYLPTYIYVQ